MSHTDIDYIEEDIDNLPANISQQMHIIRNTFFWLRIILEGSVSSQNKRNLSILSNQTT